MEKPEAFNYYLSKAQEELVFQKETTSETKQQEGEGEENAGSKGTADSGPGLPRKHVFRSKVVRLTTAGPEADQDLCMYEDRICAYKVCTDQDTFGKDAKIPWQVPLQHVTEVSSDF